MLHPFCIRTRRYQCQWNYSNFDVSEIVFTTVPISSLSLTNPTLPSDDTPSNPQGDTSMTFKLSSSTASVLSTACDDMITIDTVQIPTRYFLAPINTGFFESGLPTEGLRRFHLERSGRSIGISFVGNVAIDREYVNSPRTAFLTEHQSWADIASCITNNGSLPGIQIACRSNLASPPKKWKNRNVLQYIEQMRSYLLSLPSGYIDQVFDRFVWASSLSYKLGYKVIQIHAAHGYFLSLLLSDVINKRNDKYGDGVTSILNLIDSIRSLGQHTLLDIRLSLSQGFRDREDEVIAFRERLQPIFHSAIDIISLSDGFYDVNKFQIYPRRKDGFACYLNIASQLAIKYPNKTWNVAGNIWNLSGLSSQLPKNLSFSIGRSLIADPAFVEKSLRGVDSSITHCTRSGHCHFYSRNRQHIECCVNPNVAGDSLYLKPIHHSDSKSISDS